MAITWRRSGYAMQPRWGAVDKSDFREQHGARSRPCHERCRRKRCSRRPRTNTTPCSYRAWFQRPLPSTPQTCRQPGGLLGRHVFHACAHGSIARAHRYSSTSLGGWRQCECTDRLSRNTSQSLCIGRQHRGCARVARSTSTRGRVPCRWRGTANNPEKTTIRVWRHYRRHDTHSIATVAGCGTQRGTCFRWGAARCWCKYSGGGQEAEPGPAPCSAPPESASCPASFGRPCRPQLLQRGTSVSPALCSQRWRWSGHQAADDKKSRRQSA
mmetsp:Transcript_110764/g.220292  ORF Transcript_110764/g.220292 Transcript_110764/m.220292 type:complete len:270 (-) Transcript_110764:420-1229(-)